MNRRRAWIATALISAVTLTTLGQSDAPIALPSDPSEIVIALDWYGYWQDRVRKNPQPQLTIRADGSVRVTDPRSIWPDFQSRLSSAELQDLLRFIARDQDFFALDATNILRDVEAVAAATNSRVIVEDGRGVVMRVKTADRDKEIRYYAVEDFVERYPADRFPSLKALGQLRALQTRLEQLTEEVRGGGTEVINQALVDANDYLRREQPDAPPFTAGNYFGTLLDPDGRSKSVRFVREIAGGSRNSVAVQYRPNEQPEFRFTVYQSRPSPVAPR